MKRFALAVALTGIISATALAGNVPTGDFVSPPPPPQAATASRTSSTLVENVVVNLIITITTLIGR